MQPTWHAPRHLSHHNIIVTASPLLQTGGPRTYAHDEWIGDLVALRAQNVRTFVRKPPAACLAALVFGNDAGLVSEQASALATAFAARETPPGEIIRIEDADLEGDPDKLTVELQTLPMFGGGKVIRTTLSRRVTGAMLKGMFASGPPAAHLVVEGGNLKPTDAARKLFEGAAWAAAVPCYADTTRDLDGIVSEMLGAAGLKIEQDAREVLLSRLGADRALSRGEIEKLTLYAAGQDTIRIEDVSAVVGDASEYVMDKIANAAATGQSAAALRDFDRACAGGDTPQTLLLALQRHFLRLHRLRATVESGKSMDEAMRSLRPPVHMKQRETLAAQCQAWPLPRLSAALQRISSTIKATRLNSGIEGPLAERLIIDLAQAVRQNLRKRA